jgi:hypothetical protein
MREWHVDALGPYRSLPVVVAPPKEGSVSKEHEELVRQMGAQAFGTWEALRGVDVGTEPTPANWKLVVVPEVESAQPAVTQGFVNAFFRGPSLNEVRLRLVLKCPRQEEFFIRKPAGRTNWIGRTKMVKEWHERTVFEECGDVLWEDRGGGSLDDVVDHATLEATQALSEQMVKRRDAFVSRSAGDERFILSPSSLTLEPGTVVFSDDEALLFHMGVGVSRRVELDLALGGFPIPAAGAVPVPPLGIVGGAGAAVIGMTDFGVKVKVLDEGPHRPGVAVSYDLLDVWGAALGGAGFLGYGVAGVAAGGALNLQFNVFSVAVNKHFFEQLQLGGGAVLIDNHHILPQGAAYFLSATDGSGAGAGGGTTGITRLPDMFIPYINAEWAFYPGFRFIQEASAGYQWRDRFGATGLRLVLGSSENWHWLALSRIRFKFDAAVVEAHDASGWHALPWLGFGLYFL